MDYALAIVIACCRRTAFDATLISYVKKEALSNAQNTCLLYARLRQFGGMTYNDSVDDSDNYIATTQLRMFARDATHFSHRACESAE